jgi:hypothetical protein
MFPTAKDFTRPITVTIKSGTALSDLIDLRRYPNAGYTMPAAWTAASIAFKVSYDGVNFFSLKNAAGTLIEHATPASGDARALPAEVASFYFVKLWSETGGTGVNQAADRVFLVGTKG